MRLIVRDHVSGPYVITGHILVKDFRFQTQRNFEVVINNKNKKEEKRNQKQRRYTAEIKLATLTSQPAHEPLL